MTLRGNFDSQGVWVHVHIVIYLATSLWCLASLYLKSFGASPMNVVNTGRLDGIFYSYPKVSLG